MTQETRQAFVGAVERYRKTRKLSLEAAYSACEAIAVTVHGERVFKTYVGFRKYRSRQANVTRYCESGPNSQEIQKSVPIYEWVGLSIRVRDKERPKSARINEMDKLKRDEETMFLQRCVDSVNAEREKTRLGKVRKWTLDEIRADVAERRKRSMEEFSREVQMEPLDTEREHEQGNKPEGEATARPTLAA